MTPLVFLSSTKMDLLDHRRAVQRELLGFDILYRGMEYFGSRPQKPRDVMLDEVVQCDLYVGIVAKRYGSWDPATGLSYTHLEYQTAIKNQIPTMLFLMDANHPVRDEHRDETDEARIRLKEFRDVLADKHTPEWFTTPEDLAAKVAHSLSRWLAKNEPEWRRMQHQPMTDFEDTYIRMLHSKQGAEVREAIDRLSTSRGRLVHEHLYSTLYRRDLAERDFRTILLQLNHSQDERRVAQILLNVAKDLPERRKLVLFAIGHRALIDDRRITDDETLCVLRHDRDPSPEVRYEAAHALGKILLRPSRLKQQGIDALRELLTDENERVSEKAREALQRIPADPAARAAG